MPSAGRNWKYVYETVKHRIEERRKNIDDYSKVKSIIIRRIEIMICPRCKGNGYFRVLENKTPYSKRDIVVQCPCVNQKEK